MNLHKHRRAAPWLLTTLALVAAAPAAAGIASVTGLTAVRAYEATFSNNDGTGTFAAGDTRLTARINPLTGNNRDFGAYPDDENYDIFYSDALGNLSASGSFLTIEGNCNVPYGCFNITGVSIFRGASEEFANVVTHVVYGRPGSFAAGSHVNAVDGNPNSWTNLGDTIGLGSNARMSLTVGFASVPTGSVPEPASWALLIAGFGMVGAAQRRVQRIRLQPARARG